MKNANKYKQKENKTQFKSKFRWDQKLMICALMDSQRIDREIALRPLRFTFIFDSIISRWL